jgi:peroxiredoxin
MKANKSKKTKLKQDCCDLCPEINEMAKKIKKKKKVRKKFPLKKTTLPIVGMLLLGIFGFSKLGSVLETSEQVSNQAENAVKGSEIKGLQINSIAPDFTTEDLLDNQISLSDYRNQKPVLLIFWATWCSFCKKELPDLKEFTQKYQSEIQVIVLPSGEVKSTIVDYVKKEEINFMVLLDEQRKVWDSYLVRGTPNHFLINKEGKITTLWPGLATLNDLETMFKMIPN